MVLGINDEEVQCPLCLRYHNVQRKSVQSDEELPQTQRPSFGEVICGTTKVMGAAGVVAMLLSRREISSKLEHADSLSLSNLRMVTRNGHIAPNFGKLVMTTMVLTGVVYSVWSWVYKQKLRRQREEEFRGNLEICKECWGQIREVLLNEAGDSN